MVLNKITKKLSLFSLRFPPPLSLRKFPLSNPLLLFSLFLLFPDRPPNKTMPKRRLTLALCFLGTLFPLSPSSPFPIPFSSPSPLSGYGVEENNETAVGYFEEALQIEENAHALIHLGNMYRHGTGVPQDLVGRGRRKGGRGRGGR